MTETDLVGRELMTVSQDIFRGKGDNIYLTIDYYIQQFAENAVENAFVKYNAKSTSCIVMNAKTGEILAMAQDLLMTSTMFHGTMWWNCLKIQRVF